MYPYRIDGTARDDDAFDNWCGSISIRGVFASPGSDSSALQDYVFGLRRILRHERPLQASRKPAPPRPRKLDFLTRNNRFPGSSASALYPTPGTPELQRHVILWESLMPQRLLISGVSCFCALVQRGDPLRLRRLLCRDPRSADLD